jgi:hypothetical protein
MEMKRKDIELRDWYAGLAMQAIVVSRLNAYRMNSDFIELATYDAHSIANAMMDRRAEIMDSE